MGVGCRGFAGVRWVAGGAGSQEGERERAKREKEKGTEVFLLSISVKKLTTIIENDLFTANFEFGALFTTNKT